MADYATGCQPRQAAYATLGGAASRPCIQRNEQNKPIQYSINVAASATKGVSHAIRSHDNKPFAVMINLGDEDVQDVFWMLSRLRAQMAARSIRGRRARMGSIM